MVSLQQHWQVFLQIASAPVITCFVACLSHDWKYKLTIKKISDHREIQVMELQGGAAEHYLTSKALMHDCESLHLVCTPVEWCTLCPSILKCMLYNILFICVYFIHCMVRLYTTKLDRLNELSLLDWVYLSTLVITISSSNVPLSSSHSL